VIAPTMGRGRGSNYEPTMPTSNQFSFDNLPDCAYLRQSQLVQSPATPTALLPFSAATLWRKVKSGTFPKPIKLSERVTAWPVGAVREWMRGVQP